MACAVGLPKMQVERSIRACRTKNKAIVSGDDPSRQICTCLIFGRADGSTPNLALQRPVGKLSTKPVDTLAKSNTRPRPLGSATQGFLSIWVPRQAISRLQHHQYSARPRLSCHEYIVRDFQPGQRSQVDDAGLNS